MAPKFTQEADTILLIIFVNFFRLNQVSEASQLVLRYHFITDERNEERGASSKAIKDHLREGRS